MAVITVDIADVLWPVNDPAEIPVFMAMPAGTYVVDENGNFMTDENGAFWVWE